ncbi:MAG: UDP-N-acetylmuramate--L-alanine ligase [Clostridia bacterium]|nr:UDP-N-acetylmuramate--L-alanine ligase [Clostridia bacterium]
MALPNTSYGREKIDALMKNNEGVWFLGIGGVSMSALAEMTLSKGYRVGGADRTCNERSERLRRMGAEVEIGEGKSIPKGYGAVVYTVAIGEENLQYVYAKNVGIPCISRADYMGWLTGGYGTRVGIAGMHGKSTCTAMCAEIFLRAGDPTVLAGAELPALGGKSCRIGKGKETVVFEACEYRDAFLRFRPNVAVVLNIGMDHVDYFKSMEQIRRSFQTYADLAKDGVLLWNLDDPESRTAFSGREGAKTFSVDDPSADFCAEDIRINEGQIDFTVRERGGERYPIKVRAVGRHHIYNTLAAVGAARLSGITPETIVKAMTQFRGAARRMEYKGKIKGCPIYDDYAHHPDEIKATLAGARTLVPKGGRMVCVYQPHTYSRTAGLFDAFAKAFGEADEVLFTDIYAAREQNESGVTAEALAKATSKNGTKACYTGDLTKAAEAIAKRIKSNDVLLVMGAGDVDEILKKLPVQTDKI